jgi:hypothetical protein
MSVYQSIPYINAAEKLADANTLVSQSQTDNAFAEQLMQQAIMGVGDQQAARNLLSTVRQMMGEARLNQEFWQEQAKKDKESLKKENELVKLRQENIQLQEYKEQSVKIQEEHKEQIKEHKEQIKEHKEQIKELQDKIERMAMKAIEKPTTTNNLILSPIDLSQEHISKVIAEKFTKEHFYDGQAGVARFAFDNILKDKDGKLAYVCTDVARHIFKHVDENGEVVKDVRASKLTKKLTADVKKMSGQIVIKKTKEEEEAKVNCSFFLTKKMEEISNIGDDNSKFRMELANLTVEK